MPSVREVSDDAKSSTIAPRAKDLICEAAVSGALDATFARSRVQGRFPTRLRLAQPSSGAVGRTARGLDPAVSTSLAPHMSARPKGPSDSQRPPKPVTSLAPSRVFSLNWLATGSCV